MSEEDRHLEESFIEVIQHLSIILQARQAVYADGRPHELELMAIHDLEGTIDRLKHELRKIEMP